MLTQGLRKADFMRLLGVHGSKVDRLLDLPHKSRLEQVDDALAKIGYRLRVAVEPTDRRDAAWTRS